MVASATAHSALPRDRIRSFSLHAPPSQGSPQLGPNVERRAYTPFVQRRMCDDNRLGIRHAADSHALRGSHRTALVIVSWNGRTPLGCHQIIILQQPGINIHSDWLYHLGSRTSSFAIYLKAHRSLIAFISQCSSMHWGYSRPSAFLLSLLNLRRPGV
jgi:hypothetical protein